MNLIKEVISKIAPLDQILMEKAQVRLDHLTKPQGSLGRLEEIAKLMVGITGKENPETKRKVIFTLAADHGIADEGVSAFPKAVTAQMVYNFVRGGAGINVLARMIGAKVIIVDMGVAEKLTIDHQDFRDKKIALGTKNMMNGPAMTREEAEKAIETGIELFEEEFKKNGVDMVGTGEMGIGNTTASSALVSVFSGKSVETVTGRGTGIDDNTLSKKIGMIKKAIEKNCPNPKDAIDVLSKLGGYEIGGLAGIMLAAASKRVPIVVDGFISSAAALTAYHIEPKVKNYFILSHLSVENGHKAFAEYLNMAPLLDFNMRLGEGTGAALGMQIVEASVRILTEMATFQSAGVSNKA